jgi:hypothetical protein
MATIRNRNNPVSTKTNLGKLADIAIGYQHREKISHAEHGSHRLIQGKDVVRTETMAGGTDQSAGWRLLTDNLDRVTPKGDAVRYLLQPGDVLFVSRGTTNIAVPLNEDTVHPFPEDWSEIIPAYTFYLLRPDRSRVVPEYLAWYINQPIAQAYLTQQSRGTLVKLLPKTIFEELEVPVPSLIVQQQVMEIENLRAREESLLKQLIAARLRLVQHACLAAVTTQPHSNPA